MASRLAACAAVLFTASTASVMAQSAMQPAGDVPQSSSADATEADAAIPAAAPGEAPTGAVGGMGDVNLYPRRVVISGRERSATVGLYNRAAASGEYDISISDMMMTPDGRVVDLGSVADPAAVSRVKVASPYLRWSPRKVVLPASEAQLVRIMVRVPPDLPAGEYRSHFSAVSVPPLDDGLSIEQAAGGQNGGVGVQIVPRFGISIPVIVRVGETTAQASLANLALQRGPQTVIKVTIARQGTRSVFGDLTVTAPGSKAPVGQLKGIGVYTEIDERTVQVPVDPALDPALYANGAKLTVTYTDDDYAPGQVLAKADFVVK
ncbi:MAG: hypothetical protein B7Y36_17080 [Novosphingobium sp. 28-62-57]|uniref:hypothetical protein n=1 Tax=unclassified Novosphingobium TaxID=2644732 RepID=UPI000BDDA557|nr:MULTISPECIES: hypothetical protein [unclassified Novosphingobium]OYW47653.1 MAG: hypothetical protein B7Z36_02505 [Novosphingobium sp. 12-63-9]OYZ43458.1 MAG: hypothetical protein B7Y31_03875 [Novosphingobium sp. 16-62-11]OZA30822.1 MAG: hypothetical protein B7X92_15580 [Novosphingobium sp. 17-62-9]OYZ08397.1 MAG: hypothetical protein B7Y36_17080 [Novosphingobium sp. 28-62-57]HQS68933.1 hypothetical protein [Novosphingobium sp.]